MPQAASRLSCRLLLVLALGCCWALPAGSQAPPPAIGPDRPPPPPGQAPPPPGQAAAPAPPPTASPPVASTPAATESATLDLEIAVNRARLYDDAPGLGTALLQLARHHQQQSRPAASLIATSEALVLADQERDDALGLEAAQLATEAYRSLDDAAMVATSRQRADAYRERLARKAAAKVALPTQAPTVGTTTLAPAATAPHDLAGTPPDPAPGDAGPSSGAPLAWLLLAAFLFLLWSWRRSLRKAEALQEETERLARHQRQLKSAHQDLQQQAQQLRQTATHDALTGVLTRKAFASAFEDLAKHAQHYGKPVSLMVFDLDHFKAINDSHGHLVGDSALKLVAGVVREKLDSDDLFGRFGGDEFLVGCMDLLPEQALDLAEGIRAAVKRHAEAGDEKLAVLSLSIGVANSDATRGYDSADLFKRADAALYAAKRAGRNRAMLADDAINAGSGQFPLRSLAAE